LNEVEKPWYSPGEITFTPLQVIYLLQNYESISTGNWPRDPNAVKNDNLSPRGYFEAGIEVWMEFEPRLKATGRDGEMAVDFYCYQKDEARLAYIYGCYLNQVNERIGHAVKYISGKSRKRRTYQEFLHHRKAHSKARMRLDKKIIDEIMEVK